MIKAIYMKILTCLMLVIFPAAMFAADQPAAMLYSHGTALLNGDSIERSSAIFSGDLVETGSGSAANINAPGSIVLVLNGSLVQYEGNAVNLEHGGVTVSTSKSLATRAGDVNVAPAASVWTEFEVRDVDGRVQIMARKVVQKCQTMPPPAKILCWRLLPVSHSVAARPTRTLDLHRGRLKCPKILTSSPKPLPAIHR
jgi:hypothetical protein